MGVEDDRRDSEDAPGDSPRSVAPGALTALLEEIARTPDSGPALSLPRAGEVVGRFELVRELGHGGFGVVYEAWDRELRRSVAFKLVRAKGYEVGEDQLRREAEAIAQLSHPNLVTLFDVGRCEHGPYLVLELLRGRTLEQRLREGSVPVDETLRLATEIAKGMGHAHGRGVVHRDLKPSNVFLCGEGQVKLLDFGMSRVFGRPSVKGGTPAYMAPEQWSGAPEDERTDVFALGVILHEMLSGKLPFTPGDGEKGAPSFRRAPVLEVPEALSRLVGRMLEKDPTRRPRDGAEVSAALAALTAPAQRPSLPTLGGVRRVRRPSRRAALLVAGIAIVGGALAALLLRERPPAPPPGVRSIAVLPFANMSDSPDNDYFSDGLTEEILNLLTRVRELKVAASASSFRFKNAKEDTAELGKRLRVDVVLVGNVRREQGRLRVGAELVDARSGFRVWSQIYDRQLADVFAIQDDIARQVVGALELVLSRVSRKELDRGPTSNLAAYDAYLRGRDYLRKPSTAQNLEQATALFEQAIAADAGFAQAYAGLCEAWLSRYELMQASESFVAAEKSCGAALERGGDALEVHVALGNLHLAAGKHQEAERDFKGASGARPSVDALLGIARTYAAERQVEAAEHAFEQARLLDPADWRVYQQRAAFLFGNGRYLAAATAYREVLRLTPDNANAYNNLGASCYLAGRFEEATRAWRGSLALAPTTGAYSNVGSSLFYLSRFEEAAAMYAKASELSPHDYKPWGNLGDAYTFAPGRAADASRAYERAVIEAEARLRINPGDAEAIAELARFHARLGHARKARALRAEALSRDAASIYVRYNAALVGLKLGEPEEALSQLESAVALGYQRALLKVDAALAPLRATPRFEALVSPPLELPKDDR